MKANLRPLLFKIPSSNIITPDLTYALLTNREVKIYINASVNSTCAQVPPGLTPGNSHFFALDGKFPGVGTLELANPPGWGRKKRANAPSSVNSATFIIDRTVQ